MLILGEASEELRRNIQSCRSLMTSLGFVVNSKKSIPGLTQKIEFLGFVVNLRWMTLAVTKKKLKSLTSQSKNLLQSQCTIVHHLAQVIGTMTSLNQAVLPVPLYYWVLQELRKESLGLMQFSDLAESESNDGSEVVDRSWESVEIEILTSQPGLTIESDASNLGQLACPPRMQQEVFGAVRSGFFTSIARRSWQHGWVSNVM